MVNGLDEDNLKTWIETSLRDNTHELAAGYQGKTLLYQDNERRMVIKTPHGSGLTRYIHTLLLRHEHNVYKQLRQFEGAPVCHGLVDRQYLVLEWINGEPIRQRRPSDPDHYFESLFAFIEQMHKLGVAHMDLKRKDNLLVTHDDRPCLIDFGTAIIKKTGFRPLNAYLFDLARKFDYNAWIKHKYDNRRDIADEDRAYFSRTRIEMLSRFIKKTYTRIFSSK